MQAAKGLIWGTQLPGYRCKRYLQTLVSFNRRHPDAVAEAGRQLHPKMPEWLKTLFIVCPDGELPSARRKSPAWILTDLPPLIHAKTGRMAVRRAAELLVENLASTPRGRSPVGVEELRAVYTGDSLADVVAALFLAWTARGAPSREGWVLDALGHFGDDRVVERLVPLVVKWPSQNLHERAKRALEALARIGSDAALCGIDSVSRRVKASSVRARAREYLQEAAKQRGLSEDELGDRVVPTLGLTAKGARLLEAGGRTFRVGFDEHLVPYVVDVATGRRQASLPRASSSGDATQTATANAVWKSLRKQAKEVAKTQLVRLELAMARQRRWTVADFKALFVEHPLMIHLVRRLLWGTFNGDGCTSMFRVAEDNSLTNVDDEPFTLPPDASVGLVHRSDMDAMAVGRWTEVWSDYELIQPFEQLNRAVFELSATDDSTQLLDRYQGYYVSVWGLKSLLKRGWSDKMYGGEDVVPSLRLELPKGRSAELWFEPGIERHGKPSGDQKLGTVELSRVTSQQRVLASEMLRDLEWLVDDADR